MDTFYKAILRPLDESNFDEFVAMQVVSFMLDFYDEILSPPAGVKSLVNERLRVLQKPQVTS